MSSTGSVVQSSRVSGGPPRGWGGSYHFCTRIPHESRGWGGPRIVVNGHWEGDLWLSVTGKEG